MPSRRFPADAIPPSPGAKSLGIALRPKGGIMAETNAEARPRITRHEILRRLGAAIGGLDMAEEGGAATPTYVGQAKAILLDLGTAVEQSVVADARRLPLGVVARPKSPPPPRREAIDWSGMLAIVARLALSVGRMADAEAALNLADRLVGAIEDARRIGN